MGKKKTIGETSRVCVRKQKVVEGLPPFKLYSKQEFSFVLWNMSYLVLWTELYSKSRNILNKFSPLSIKINLNIQLHHNQGLITERRKIPI